MTTYGRESQVCCLCNTGVECTVLFSTNAFGSPDLDLRPPAMRRDTMHAWLHECPACGYVNHNLSETIPGAEAVVASDEYTALGTDAALPGLARRFARFSLLQRADPEAAGIARLQAAWVCDDASQPEQARAQRSQAADFLLTLQPFEDDPQQTTLATLLVDVLRRAGRAYEARSLAGQLQTFSAVQANDTVAQVLKYQCRLCDLDDAGCHTIDEAV